MNQKILLIGMLVGLFMLGGCNVRVTNLDEIDIPQPEKQKIYRFIDFESPQHLYFSCRCDDGTQHFNGSVTIGWELETREIEETERFIVNHYEKYYISTDWMKQPSDCIITNKPFNQCHVHGFYYTITEEGITYKNRCHLEYTDNEFLIQEQIINCFKGVK